MDLELPVNPESSAWFIVMLTASYAMKTKVGLMHYKPEI